MSGANKTSSRRRFITREQALDYEHQSPLHSPASPAGTTATATHASRVKDDTVTTSALSAPAPGGHTIGNAGIGLQDAQDDKTTAATAQPVKPSEGQGRELGRSGISAKLNSKVPTDKEALSSKVVDSPWSKQGSLKTGNTQRSSFERAKQQYAKDESSDRKTSTEKVDSRLSSHKPTSSSSYSKLVENIVDVHKPFVSESSRNKTALNSVSAAKDQLSKTIPSSQATVTRTAGFSSAVESTFGSRLQPAGSRDDKFRRQPQVHSSFSSSVNTALTAAESRSSDIPVVSDTSSFSPTVPLQSSTGVLPPHDVYRPRSLYDTHSHLPAAPSGAKLMSSHSASDVTSQLPFQQLPLRHSGSLSETLLVNKICKPHFGHVFNPRSSSGQETNSPRSQCSSGSEADVSRKQPWVKDALPSLGIGDKNTASAKLTTTTPLTQRNLDHDMYANTLKLLLEPLCTKEGDAAPEITTNSQISSNNFSNATRKYHGRTDTVDVSALMRQRETAVESSSSLTRNRPQSMRNAESKLKNSSEAPRESRPQKQPKPEPVSENIAHFAPAPRLKKHKSGVKKEETTESKVEDNNQTSKPDSGHPDAEPATKSVLESTDSHTNPGKMSSPSKNSNVNQSTTESIAILSPQSKGVNHSKPDSATTTHSPSFKTNKNSGQFGVEPASLASVTSAVKPSISSSSSTAAAVVKTFTKPTTSYESITPATNVTSSTSKHSVSQTVAQQPQTSVGKSSASSVNTQSAASKSISSSQFNNTLASQPTVSTVKASSSSASTTTTGVAALSKQLKSSAAVPFHKAASFDEAFRRMNIAKWNETSVLPNNVEKPVRTFVAKLQPAANVETGNTESLIPAAADKKEVTSTTLVFSKKPNADSASQLRRNSDERVIRVGHLEGNKIVKQLSLESDRLTGSKLTLPQAGVPPLQTVLSTSSAKLVLNRSDDTQTPATSSKVEVVLHSASAADNKNDAVLPTEVPSDNYTFNSSNSVSHTSSVPGDAVSVRLSNSVDPTLSPSEGITIDLSTSAAPNEEIHLNQSNPISITASSTTTLADSKSSLESQTVTPETSSSHQVNDAVQLEVVQLEVESVCNAAPALPDSMLANEEVPALPPVMLVLSADNGVQTALPSKASVVNAGTVSLDVTTTAVCTHTSSIMSKQLTKTSLAQSEAATKVENNVKVTPSTAVKMENAAKIRHSFEPTTKPLWSTNKDANMKHANTAPPTNQDVSQYTKIAVSTTNTSNCSVAQAQQSTAATSTRPKVMREDSFNRPDSPEYEPMPLPKDSVIMRYRLKKREGSSSSSSSSSESESKADYHSPHLSPRLMHKKLPDVTKRISGGRSLDVPGGSVRTVGQLPSAFMPKVNSTNASHSARAKNGNVEPASSSSRGASKSKMKRSFTLPAAAASLLLPPPNSPPPTDISILTQSAGSTVNQSPDITVDQCFLSDSAGYEADDYVAIGDIALESASSSDTDCPRIAQEAAKLATSSTSKPTANAAAQHSSTATSGVKESKYSLGSSSFAAAKLSENTSKLTSSNPWTSPRVAVSNSKLSSAQPSHASPLAGRKLEGYDARSFPVTKPQRSRPASEVVLSASRQRISSSPSADLGWLLSKAAIVPPHCGGGNATANSTMYTSILAPSSANTIVNSTGIASPPRSPRSLRYLPKDELPQTTQFGFQPESSIKGSVSVTKAQFQSTASGVNASKSQATTTSSLWSKGNSRVPIASPPRSPQLNRLPGTSQAREKINRASQFSSSDSHKPQQSPLLQRKATVSFSGGVSQMPTTSPHASPIPVRRQPGTQHAQIQLTLSDEKLQQQQQQRAAESSQSLAVVTVTPSVTRPLSSSQVFPVRSPNMTRKPMPVHRAISDTPVSPVAGGLNSPLVRRQQSSSSSVSGGVISRDEGPLSARSVDQALAELTSVLDSMQQQQQSASLEKSGHISPNISQTSLLVSTSSAFTAVAPSSTQSSQLSAVNRHVMSPGCSAAALTLVDSRSQHADEDAQERRSSLSSLSSHGDHANATAVLLSH